MLFTAFDYRFSPVSMKIRELIHQNAVGRVGYLRLVYLWNLHGMWTTGPDGVRRENARRCGRMDEGGPLVDCGMHQVDLARWWLGSEPVCLHGEGAWLEDHEIPGHVVLHMDHANRCHTHVKISYAHTRMAVQPRATFTYEIIGTDGLIRLMLMFLSLDFLAFFWAEDFWAILLALALLSHAGDEHG